MNPKVVIVGPAGVGKSDIVRQATGGAPPTQYTSTLGVEVHTATVNGTHYNIWDCGGWDGLFAGLRGAYAIDAQYIVVVGANTDDTMLHEYTQTSPNAQVIHIAPGTPLSQVL